RLLQPRRRLPRRQHRFADSSARSERRTEALARVVPALADRRPRALPAGTVRSPRALPAWRDRRRYGRGVPRSNWGGWGGYADRHVPWAGPLSEVRRPERGSQGLPEAVPANHAHTCALRPLGRVLWMNRATREIPSWLACHNS